MTEGNTPMSSDQMELIAELAASRAIAKHEAANIERLRYFEHDLNKSIMAAKNDCKKYTDDKITAHETGCPIGLDYKLCKAKLIGVMVGIGLGSSGFTIGLSKLLGIL